MLPQIVPSGFLPLVETQLEHQEALLSRANVVGVALGYKHTRGVSTGERAIAVLVRRKVGARHLAADALVPTTVGGVPTDVQEIGLIEAGGGPALPGERGTHGVGPFQLGQRVRPAFAGVSVGHYRVSAGTLGAGCFDAVPADDQPDRYYLLSNNHVLAQCNAATVGDPILQPSIGDGGRYPGDVIGRLARFVPIRFHDDTPTPVNGGGTQTPVNYVDAAIAEGRLPELDRRVSWATEVKRLSVAPDVNDIVQKWGRTTNFTTGLVLNVNATVDVRYDGGRVARFCQQIVTSRMSAGGDSGSLVTDANESAVGLLFAGSSRVTVLNHILYVQALLGVRITDR